MSCSTGTENIAAIKDLSATAVCRIIEACSKAGVAQFDCAGLRISFHPTASQGPEREAHSGPSVAPVESPTEEIQINMLDQSAIEEAAQAQLLIDDSMAFEKLQISQHLERSRNLHGVRN